MFTGIIQAIGKIQQIEQRGGDLRLTIHSGKLDLGDVALGDSLACNGVCLTVAALTGQGYVADVSRESLEHTTLGQLRNGSPVNLEKALTLSSRLGGHLVSGHVDGIGRVLQRHADARSLRLRIQAPHELARYIAHKGSICVDGVSLTVNKVEGATFDLNLIPHSVQETTIGQYRNGTQVNLEVDLIARYLERLLQGNQAAAPANNAEGVTLDMLVANGFNPRRTS